MKILKWILIVVVIIIAIPLTIALFTAKEYTVERNITINKPKAVVFDYIKLLKNQPNYSAWAMRDPNSKMDYTGTDGTPGFVSSWDSKIVGKGEQEIKGVTEGERLDLGLHFIKPFDARADAWFNTSAPADNQTKVIWGIHGKMAYPMNFMMIIMNMDKELGADLETGLNNLKGVMEKQ